jgi:hypothetical protein
MTIHDNIDNYLAADLHNELSDKERDALHTHLVECAACRQTHQENKIMNKVLEKTLTTEKPDPAFEQRMLAGFRNRNPQKTGGIAKLIVDLMRLRATQIAAVAAVLLALVQIGRLITGEGAAMPRNREYLGGEEYATRLARAPQALTDELSAVRKSENGRDKEATAGRLKSSFGISAPQNAAAPATPQQPEVHSKSYVLEEREPTEAATGPPATVTSPDAAATANRKLIRNANIDLEVVSFDDVVQ